MAVIVPDCVAWVACDDCPNTRVIVSEIETRPRRNSNATVRVTVFEGCDRCEGSTVVM